MLLVDFRPAKAKTRSDVIVFVSVYPFVYDNDDNGISITVERQILNDEKKNRAIKINIASKTRYGSL